MPSPLRFRLPERVAIATRMFATSVLATSVLTACASAPPTPGATPTATAATPGGRGALGIPPFAVAGAASDSTIAPLSFALADLLATDLARSRRLTLVERTRLGEVLRELDLSAAGRVDSASAPRVGRLIQAQQLVVGSVSVLPEGGGQQIRLGVQLADVERGTLERAIDARAPLNDILAAEKEIAFRLFDALGIVLTPDERAAVAQRPTRDLSALVAYGRGVRLEILGDYRGAEDAYRRARRLDPGFQGASVRANGVRQLATTGVSNPVIVPGIRAVDATVGSLIDRLNRPLDLITSTTSSGRTTDAAFPSTAATVIITVTRP